MLMRSIGPWWRITRSVALGGIALALTTLGAIADMPTGKPITILVPSSPGGGYDTYARLVANHIGKHLPGGPKVVVRNMPGAGGAVLANHLYARAPKDGSEFGVMQDSILFVALTTGRKTEFDTRGFSWLGAVERFVPIVVLWHASPFQTFEDTKQRTASLGSSGAGSSTDAYSKLLNGIFGSKFRVVNGYPGSAEILLAIERGEVDGMAGWCYECMKAQKPAWIAERKARVLLQLSMEGDPELSAQGVPTLADLAKTDEQRQAIGLVFSGVVMARPFAAPPGVPAEALAVLRKAFAATVRDAEFLADAARGRNSIVYTSPERMEQIVAKAFASDPAIVQKVQKMLNE